MKGMKKKMREDEKKEKKQKKEAEVSDCAEKREETKVRKGEREKERNSFLREETKNASSSSRHQQTSCEEDSSRFFRRASSCPAPRDFALLREGSSPSSSLASSLSSSSSSSSSSEKSTNTSDEEEEEQEGREEERNEEEEDGEDEDGVTWDVWKGKDRTERRDHMREAKESRGRCRRTHSEEDLAELVEFLLSRGRRGTQEEEQERRRREEGKKGSVYLSRKFSKSEKTSPHAGTISLGGVIEEEKQEEKDKKKRGKEQQKEDEEGHVDDDEGKPISHSHTSSPSPSSLPPGVRPIVGDFSRTGSSVKSSDFYQKNPLASGVLKKKTLVLAFGKNTYGQLAFPLKHRDQPVVVDFSSVHSSSFQTPHASPLKLSSSSRPSSSPIHRTPSRKEKISSSSPVREGNSPSTFVSSAQGGGGVSSRSSSWRLRRDVSRVYCGRYHSAALLEGGYVCLWGRNTCGQLGRGGFDDDDEEEEEGEGEEKREGSPCSHDEETSLIGVEKTKKKSVSAPSSPSSRYRGLPRERYFQKKDEVTLYGEKESESSLTGKCEGKETNGDEGREQDEETGGSEEVKKRDESSRRDSSGECRDEKRDMVERERRQGEEEERKEESEAFQEKKEGWEKREQGGEGRRRSRSAGDEGMMRRKERQGGGEEEEIHLGETRRRSCKDGFSCLLRDIEKASAHRDKGEEERENKEEEEEGERRRNQMRRMKKTLSFKTSYYSDPDERSSESSSSSSSHAVTPSYRRYPLYPPSSHLPDPHEHHPSHPHPDSSSTYRDPNKSNEASCISPTASSPNISRPSPPSSVPWYKRLLLFRRSSPQRGTPRRRDLSTSSSPPGVSRSSSKKEEKEDVERSTHSKSSSTPREKQGCRDTSCTSSSSSSSQRVRTPERSFTSFHTWFSSGKKSKKAGEQDAAAMKKKKIIDKRSSSSSSKKWEGGVVTVRALSLGTQGSLQRRRRRTAGMKTDKAFEWKPVLVQEFGYNASHKVIDIALGGEHSMFLCEDGSLWVCGSNADGQLGLITSDTRLPFFGCLGRPRRMPLDDSYSWPEYRRIAAPVAFIAAGFKHSALIDAKEQLWLWGNNSYGQCGLDMSGDQHAFVFLPWRVKLPQKGLGIVQVALGKYHSLCLSEEGQVYGWGRARWGVLGLGRPKEPKRRPWFFRRRHTIEPLFVTTPQPLRALCSVHVTRIVCGDSHCAAIGVSRLGREAHEEFQLLQLNDSSLRKERILEELKRRSATAYDDEDLQKASSSSHPSPPFFSLFHSPQGGGGTGGTRRPLPPPGPLSRRYDGPLYSSFSTTPFSSSTQRNLLLPSANRRYLSLGGSSFSRGRMQGVGDYTRFGRSFLMGEKTATDFHAKNSFPTSHQSPQQGEKQGEDTSHGIREQGEGGEGHHEGSKSFSDRRRRSGGGGEGEELDSLVISVSAPDDMAASAKDFPLRPPSTSRSPSPVQKERNDGSSRRRLGEKELGKEDEEEEEKKREGGRRGRGGEEEQEEDLVERQRRPAQEERKRREEGGGSSSPFMDSSSSKWMRTSITGREEGAKRVSGSYPSGSSLFPSSFEMRRGRDTVSGGLDGGANSGSSSRRRSSDLDYFLSSQEMRRSLLLSAMTPAQRYRARLFEGTRGEDEASAPIKAQSDDELLLSDLELRKRWRLPETFCRPYGSERGSAAHQGGDHLYLWGKGTEGALGCNLLKNQYSPIELPFVLSSYRPCYIQIHDIALGGDFTLTLSGSYSTSFVIDKPVPPPSPREGALFAQTSLDIYRGRESSILHTRGRREVDKVEREGRQGDEEEDEELEGKIWQPHQSLSRGGLNKKTVNGSKGEGEERQKEEEEKKKKTEKREITSPDSQKKKDKKKKTKEEKEGKREHKEEKKKKGEVPDETADESSLCLTSSFSSGDPKKSYRRGEKEEEGETKDPQGLPLPPGPAPSSPQSSFWIDKKREKEEERNPLAHSERVFSHQRARGSSRRRSSSGLSSKYNTGEEMANSDKEEGKEKQEKEKKNEEEEEEGVSSCGLRHEADHPLVPSSSQNARMGEEEKNLVNCESVREASVSPSVLSKSSVLHLPSSLDKDEEPRPLSVTPHPFTSSSSSPSSTSACTSNPSLPGIWNEVASGQTDRQEENKKKIHTLSVPLSSTHQECTLSSSLHSSLPVSYPAGISSFPSSSSSSQGVVSSSSILPVKNLPPGPHSSLSVYPSSSPGAFFLDTGNALSSSAMIPSSSSASSSSSSSPCSRRLSVSSSFSSTSMASSSLHRPDPFILALAHAGTPIMPLQLYVWGSNRGSQLPVMERDEEPVLLIPHRVNLEDLVDSIHLSNPSSRSSILLHRSPTDPGGGGEGRGGERENDKKKRTGDLTHPIASSYPEKAEEERALENQEKGKRREKKVKPRSLKSRLLFGGEMDGADSHDDAMKDEWLDLQKLVKEFKKTSTGQEEEKEKEKEELGAGDRITTGMRGEDGDDERLESEKREKEDEEGDQVCQVDRRKRGSLQHEDEEKEEERKEGGTCDDRKTIASAHEDGSKESEEEKKKKEGGVEVRVLQESSPGSSIEFDKGETEMKKEEKKTMNLDDNNDTQSDRGSGSLSGVCTPHASTMTSRANTADVDSLLSRQKEKEHPHEEEDEGRTTESQGEKHSLFCKGGVEGRRDTSSSLSSESSSLLLSSTRNDDIASLSTAIAPQASRATVNSQKEEKEENKTSRGKKTDTIASSGKKEETIDSSGKEKETFGSSKMSKSIPSEKETSSFSSISSQTPSSHPPAYRPAVHAATERILRNFERQIDSTRSLSDTKQNTLGDYRAASYNPFGNRASRCDFLQADLPLTSPSLQVLQEDTQISRMHKRDMGLKTVAALSSVVRTSPKSRSFLGGDQALNRSTRRSYQRDGKGERDGVTDKKQEGDEYDRYLYLTRHHRSSPSPPSHVDSRHPHTGDRKQKKDPSSSSSATTTTTVAGGARSFSPVFTARQSGGGDSHGSPSYDDDEASQNSSVVGRSTVTTAALKTLFSPNALILPSQQDLRSRAKKRIKFLKNFHIWRAVSSIKIRSISAGQEHSLLLLDVEYLEGSLESFFTSS